MNAKYSNMIAVHDALAGLHGFVGARSPNWWWITVTSERLVTWEHLGNVAFTP